MQLASDLTVKSIPPKSLTVSGALRFTLLTLQIYLKRCQAKLEDSYHISFGLESANSSTIA